MLALALDLAFDFQSEHYDSMIQYLEDLLEFRPLDYSSIPVEQSKQEHNANLVRIIYRLHVLEDNIVAHLLNYSIMTSTISYREKFYYKPTMDIFLEYCSVSDSRAYLHQKRADMRQSIYELVDMICLHNAIYYDNYDMLCEHILQAVSRHMLAFSRRNRKQLAALYQS